MKHSEIVEQELAKYDLGVLDRKRVDVHYVSTDSQESFCASCGMH